MSYIAEKILVGDYDPKTEDVVHRNEYFWEFFCNEILREVPTKDKFAVGKVDDMKMNLTQYDPLFWKRYNQIPESGETQKAFQDLSVAGDIEDQFRKSSDEMTRPH